jgi:hypothetical protein
MAEQSHKPQGTFSKLMSSSFPTKVQNPEKPAVLLPQEKKSPPATPSKTQVEKDEIQTSHDTMIPRHHDTTVASNHDTTTPQDEADIFEKVRKSVKQIGKEAATHRFTLEEKNLLADIEYTYKRQGIRTSENEITRIAINYFIEDYRKNGEQSILAKILKRVNS